MQTATTSSFISPYMWRRGQTLAAVAKVCVGGVFVGGVFVGGCWGVSVGV